MPKITDERVIIRAYMLRQGGLTLDGIMDKLKEEFAADVMPNRSTISRRVQSPPKGLTEDVPFEWGNLPRGVPYVQSRVSLDMLAYLDSLGYGFLLTQRVAKWGFRVILAIEQGERRVFVPQEHGEDWYPVGRIIDSPTESDLIFIALEYSWREAAAVVLKEPFHTRDLDKWIAFMPWKGDDWFKRYKGVQALNHFPPINWHMHQVEWLSKVAPRLTSFFPESPIQTRPLAEVDRVQQEFFSWATEGLLGSQVHHWLADREIGSDQTTAVPSPEAKPWYFEHLDEIERVGGGPGINPETGGSDERVDS